MHDRLNTMNINNTDKQTLFICHDKRFFMLLITVLLRGTFDQGKKETKKSTQELILSFLLCLRIIAA